MAFMAMSPVGNSPRFENGGGTLGELYSGEGSRGRRRAVVKGVIISTNF